MSNYDEKVKYLARKIKESMEDPNIKKIKEEKKKRREEESRSFKRNASLMIKVMKPLAKALMQKNRVIKDVNRKIQFSLPSESYQKCSIYIPFGLHFIISLDHGEFLLKIIQYKNSVDVKSSSSKKCALDKDELEAAAEELFLDYVKKNLI